MIPKNERFLWSDEQVIKTLQNVLAAQRVAITTTDTIPGFLAPLTERGFNTLNSLKGGRQAKPYLIVVADADKLTHFVDPHNLTATVKALVTHCWPGPLTLVFKALKSLPAYLTSVDGTVAIRCPNHTGLQALLPYFDGLFSTSANVSGAPAPVTMHDVDPSLLQSVACVVHDNGSTAGHKPSTLLDVSALVVDESGLEVGQIKLLRAGEMPIEILEVVSNKKIIR